MVFKVAELKESDNIFSAVSFQQHPPPPFFFFLFNFNFKHPVLQRCAYIFNDIVPGHLWPCDPPPPPAPE